MVADPEQLLLGLPIVLSVQGASYPVHSRDTDCLDHHARYRLPAEWPLPSSPSPRPELPVGQLLFAAHRCPVIIKNRAPAAHRKVDRCRLYSGTLLNRPRFYGACQLGG